MKFLFFSFVSLCLNCLINSSHAQVLPAKKVLVATGQVKGGTFELHRYEGDGEENLSSSSGLGYVVAGGSLEEIFSKLWPDYEFKVSRKFDKNSYTLRVNFANALDKSILDQIWNELNKMKEFTATQSSVNQSGNCIQVDSSQKLEKHAFSPKNGVLKIDESIRSQIHLDGYSLVDLANKLTQYRQLGRFYYDEGKNRGAYSFRLDGRSMATLRESLAEYGIDFKSCTKTIVSYELK
ncbi:MAG: hypothetical protein ACXIT9_02515 [Nitritalea sp.]